MHTLWWFTLLHTWNVASSLNTVPQQTCLPLAAVGNPRRTGNEVVILWIQPLQQLQLVSFRAKTCRMLQTLEWGICNSQLKRVLTSEGSWQKFLAHAPQSWPMVPASLFISQCTGSYSAGISCTTHELFCLWVVLCGAWSETSVALPQLIQFWQIPRHRTLSYPLSSPCFVTTTP
jgi:hypothetical protein